MLITFEGIDGVGKTYHSKKLFNSLQNKFGEDRVILTHEPSGFPEIKEVLLNSEIDAYTELYLFLALRREHYINVIKPAILQNKIVICDRYIDSSVAYQGYGHGIPLNFIIQLNRNTTQGHNPDLTFILDANLSCTKQQTNVNKFEKKLEDFFARVRHGFQEIAKWHPNRCKVVDINQVFDENYFFNTFEQYKNVG